MLKAYVILLLYIINITSDITIIIMMYIDRILELLQDFRWHSIEEIKKETTIPDEELDQILLFLQEQFLISKEKEKFRITPKGLKFLDLPA